MISYIANKVYNYGCSLLVDENDGKIILYRRIDGAIRLFEISIFLKQYSRYINESDEQLYKWFFETFVDNCKVTLFNWISKKSQIEREIFDKTVSLFQSQAVETERYFTHSYKKYAIEIIVYRIVANKKGLPIIDFDQLAYKSIPLSKLNMSKNQREQMSYLLYVAEDIQGFKYSKGRVLLISKSNFVKREESIYYYTENGVKIVRNKNNTKVFIQQMISEKNKNIIACEKILKSKNIEINSFV